MAVEAKLSELIVEAHQLGFSQSEIDTVGPNIKISLEYVEKILELINLIIFHWNKF